MSLVRTGRDPKVCILSSSVGFKMRPARTCADELTYGEILERNGCHVKNVSRAAVMLSEQFGLLDDDVITFFPSHVILHCGVVEICPRRVWRWPNNASVLNYYGNAFFDEPYVFSNWRSKGRVFGLRVLNGLSRHLMKLLHLDWPWMDSGRFLTVADAVINRVLKETGAQVVVCGITPCNERVEKLLPGAGAAISSANQMLAKLAESKGSRVKYLDVERLVKNRDINQLAPDGIHFSAAGHALMAEHLAEMILEPKPLA